MKRGLLIAGLALGVLAGYASGLASLRRHADRRDGFERHIASICVEAARRSSDTNAPAPPRRGW